MTAQEELDTHWMDSEVGHALAHANEQIEALFQEMREWSKDHPVRMRAAPTRASRTTTFILDESDEPPLAKWTQRLGDGLHNWRRVLDSLAWDLAARFVTAPLTETQRQSIKFPLFNEMGDFDAAAASSKKWLSSLAPEYRERLRRTQPFVASNPRESVLHWLREFDNIRKHRGGFSMRRVVDHDEGFLFMDLRDERGVEVAVPDSSIHRLSLGRDVRAGLPVLKVHDRRVVTARCTEPVPITYRVRRDEAHETDLEHLVHALSEQLVATITAAYTGSFPPPSGRSANGYGAWVLTRARHGHTSDWWTREATTSAGEHIRHEERGKHS